MPRRHGLGIAVTCGVVGALIGALVTVGGLGWRPTAQPGTVAFDGIDLTIVYTGIWPGLYGPTHQNGCVEPQLAFLPSGDRPDCPAHLTGGQQYGFGVFMMGAPTKVSEVFVNVSIDSPIPIFGYFCGYSDPPPSPALSWNLSEGLPTGAGCGLGVLLTVPDPAPSVPGGLWFQASMTVHVV